MNLYSIHANGVVVACCDDDEGDDDADDDDVYEIYTECVP